MDRLHFFLFEDEQSFDDDFRFAERFEFELDSGSAVFFLFFTNFNFLFFEGFGFDVVDFAFFFSSDFLLIACLRSLNTRSISEIIHTTPTIAGDILTKLAPSGKQKSRYNFTGIISNAIAFKPSNCQSTL